VLREKGSERLYSLADPNWNVVAICNASGNIQERYAYDAFGKHNVFDTNFTVKNGTEFNWNRAFTGQVLDIETGLMLYRNRYYHVELGRFVNRDPIEYWSYDENFYRYVQNMPAVYYDSEGFQIIITTLPPIITPRPIVITRPTPPIRSNPNFPPLRGNYPQTGPKQPPVTKPEPISSPKPGPTSPIPGPIPNPQTPDTPDDDDDCPETCATKYPDLSECVPGNYKFDDKKAADKYLEQRFGRNQDPGPETKTYNSNCPGGIHQNIYDWNGGLLATIICCPCCEEMFWEVNKKMPCNIQ
jgi:RHS repeat-associated protein